jgi:single-strand DNA-binding protein
MASGKGTINKVILIGRLGADPELKYTPTGVANTRLSIATNRVWKDESGNQIEKTDWHRVIAWRKGAEILAEYLKKGSQVYIEGRLETRSWDDQNGQKRYITEVIVEDFVLMGKKDDRVGGSAPEPPMPASPAEERPDDFAPGLQGEDDLPF